MSLSHEAVHRIRTSGLSDGYLAKVYGVTRQAIRYARTGVTYMDHPTPADRRVRESTGRRGSGMYACIVSAVDMTPSDISRALRAWRLPTTSTSEGAK